MTETKHIRWDVEPGDDTVGYVGTIRSRVFTMWSPEKEGGEWMLTAALPGCEGDHEYGTSPDELRPAAERWLEEFVSSLGATFPEQCAGRSENEGGTAVQVQPGATPAPLAGEKESKP